MLRQNTCVQSRYISRICAVFGVRLHQKLFTTIFNNNKIFSPYSPFAALWQIASPHNRIFWTKDTMIIRRCNAMQREQNTKNANNGTNRDVRSLRGGKRRDGLHALRQKKKRRGINDTHPPIRLNNVCTQHHVRTCTYTTNEMWCMRLFTLSALHASSTALERLLWHCYSIRYAEHRSDQCVVGINGSSIACMSWLGICEPAVCMTENWKLPRVPSLLFEYRILFSLFSCVCVRIAQ